MNWNMYEEEGPLATEADAVREYARNVGRDSLDRQWILSPYDTWERNPFYQGPEQPHPEAEIDYEYLYGDINE